MIRSNGDLSTNGWSSSPAVEAEVAAWYAATSPDDEKRIARRLNKAAFDHVVYAPLGILLRQFAVRKTLAGVGKGPVPFPWGVSKTA
jgi:peptide/nickel transport system substrate-binding protein